MPEQTEQGFEPLETASNTDSSSTNEQPAAPRRRRTGRRVVRGAGAAGATVELKVEEHGPLFKEPPTALPASKPVHALTAAPAAESSAEGESSPDEAAAEQAEPTRKTTRSRRRSTASETDETPRRTRRRSTKAAAADEGAETPENASEPAEEPTRTTRRRRRAATAPEPSEANRATEALDALDGDAQAESEEHEEHQSRRHHAASRPMTSLLFQEPVIPQRPKHADDETDETDESNESSDEHTTRRRRRTRGRKGDESAEATKPAAGESRRGRRRTPVDYDADFDDVEDINESTSRRRSNRRMNAQERRAAAEVEQIEEDLVLDDITYAPIDEAIARNAKRKRKHENDEEAEAIVEADLNSGSEEGEDGEPTVRRRRRRRRADHDAAEEQQNEETTESSSEDDEETTVTRRRRRRRNGKNAEEETTTRRSRKQQYIDEIADVEGSTRLEAKKQRRRDNRRERSRQNQLLEQDFLARRENVDRLMVVRQRDRHTQISVLEDNVLVEHYVSDIQEVATVGNIYLGRVQNVLPSMEAAFVDIGQARNGVLYAGEVNWDSTRLDGQPRRIELAFRSGDPVLVQVTKDPIGHKGARLTSQVTLAGRFLVLVPSGGMTGVSRKLSSRERSRLKSIVSKIAPKDMGVIIRTAAEGASEEAITKDLEALTHQWEQIQSKLEEFRHGKRPKLLQGEPDMAIRVVRDIFNDDFRKMIVEGDGVYTRIAEYLETMAPDLRDKLEKWDPAEHEGKDVFDKWQIDSQLRKGMERQVYLPSGGSIVIDRTEAMTTIDVNTGRFIGKGKSLEETVTRCNLEASEEIARQLRLRDIGGMIMIDYVDMVMPSNRDLVLRRLLECLARDRTKHQVAEVTSLGLVQMTRKRIGQGLVEAFSEECPACKGRGFIVHDEPTISKDYDDPYALKGGDPFVKTNKHGHGTEAHAVHAPKGSSAAVKAKLAQIAAAAVAANNAEEEAEAAAKQAEELEVQIEHIEETAEAEQVKAAEAAVDAEGDAKVAKDSAESEGAEAVEVTVEPEAAETADETVVDASDANTEEAAAAQPATKSVAEEAESQPDAESTEHSSESEAETAE
ncbi:ribonuclease G [Bifidobacterium pseudolongum subsp. globosum]|uniref:Ribonuclease E n=1 Tax=Bifidobacterium pseudolongum subsp. globosum TaxID=1690 RepID=A0A2N3R6Z8_9BIFI|nr:Rne/Rng family ribonuclease [Bifidobacterium pseudolongum]PKU90140.1 ribonuclease G [Bifidobacterium pseudolongum subsp. globosum]PKV05115.1 ribonuclease G [Bifidobacterium pseudolongum subsp. globosum]